MIKKLILCRHAKSDWETGQSDFDRPLKKRGKEDVARVGSILKGANFEADLILSSPAVRALTTAKGIAEWINYKDEIETNKNIYEASPGELFSIVQSLDEKYKTVMIFGHNPGMESLAGYLLGQQSPFIMPTCAMAAFDFTGEWKSISPGRPVLWWYLVPSMLRMKDHKED